MGLLSVIGQSLGDQLSSTSTVFVITAYVLALVVFTVVINVLRQLLFRNSKEAPVVLHYFPFIGSTISYGIDPYRFFFQCQKKVCSCHEWQGTEKMLTLLGS